MMCTAEEQNKKHQQDKDNRIQKWRAVDRACENEYKIQEANPEDSFKLYSLMTLALPLH